MSYTFIAPPKDPQADLDYGLDWSAWLASGETIATSTWSASPAGLTLHDDTDDGTTTTQWASSGAAGTDYTLTNRVVTSATPPRTDERSILIRVKER